MRYFSMFSGIGGFEKGIQQAYELQEMGNRPEDSTDTSGAAPQHAERPFCVGFSEVNKYAIEIYKKRYPEHKNYGDATTIDASTLPDFDLLVGGFPCQAFSIAGKRRGFNETRGTLFFDIARILAEKRPRGFVLENVKGLLSHDSGRTFKTIITTLAELGYCVEWQVLNSKNFGVPQNRERVYIVGHLGGEPRRKVFPITGSLEEADGNAIIQENNPSHSSRRVFAQESVSPTLKARAREDQTGPPLVLIPEATKKGYTEARLGQSINLAQPNSKTRRGRVSNIAATLDTGMKQYTLAVPVLTPKRPEKRQNGRRFKENGDPSFTVTSQDQHGVYDGIRIRRLTPTECERLQGFPDQWTDDTSDSQRYKCCGNAVTVNVVQAVIGKLMSTQPWE